MKYLYLTSLAFLILASASFAQAPATTAAVAAAVAAPAAKPHLISEYNLPGLDKKISLDLLDAMDVVDLLKFLAVKANLNIIIGREVAGSSKLMVKDVTLADALEIVLAANGLAYQVQGNIVKVMTDKEYREQHGESFYERKQAKIIELKSAVPSKMAGLLENVKGSLGKIVFDDSTGTLVLIDTPEKIREMENVVRMAEIPTYQRILPTVTTNFVLQYSKVEDVEPQVTAMLTKENSVGQLRTDKRTKTIIITDWPHVVQKVADVVALFDRPQKQVFIEAKIVQVILKDQFRFGVNWDYLFQGLDPRFSLKPVSTTFLPSDLTTGDRAARSGLGGGGITYHTIAGGANLNAVVEALATIGKTRILQNPHIVTLDGKEATIKSIESRPYSELQYETGSSNVVGKTYKFVEVGVSLMVTPRINELGFITCDIRPEVSSAPKGEYYDGDGTGNTGVPVVTKMFSEASVSVRDGVTIIIAGMINESETKARTQVPILGSIPLLGLLFRTEATTAENTETIVLLTPRIVTGDKFFERSRDIKKPVKGVAAPSALSSNEMTP